MTALAVTNLMQLRYAKEVTPGVIPAVAFQNLRAKSQSLDAALTYVTSQEIRSDRQVPDQILVDQAPSGQLGCEISYGATDDLLAGALQNPWHQIANISNVSVTSTSVYTVTAGGAAFVANHLVWGQGFTTAGNDTVNVVSASTGTTVTVSGTPLTIEAAGASKTIQAVGFTSAAADITATASGLGSTTLDFTTLGLTVGQWIKVGGANVVSQFATAANNAFIRVTGIQAHALTCDNLPTGWAVDAGAGKTIRVLFGDYVRNGTTQQAFTIERQHVDVTQFFQFLGMQIDQMTLTIDAGKIMEGTFTFKGMSAQQQAVTVSTGGPLLAPTNNVLNATSNVVKVNEGGGALSGYAKTFTLTVKNNMRDQKAVGVLGDVGIGDGQLNADFAVSAYFTDATIYTKFKSGTQSSLAIPVQDSAGNTIVVTMPALRYTACKVQAQQMNQDVMLAATAGAKLDSLTSSMLQFDRFPASGA